MATNGMLADVTVSSEVLRGLLGLEKRLSPKIPKRDAVEIIAECVYYAVVMYKENEAELESLDSNGRQLRQLVGQLVRQFLRRSVNGRGSLQKKRHHSVCSAPNIDTDDHGDELDARTELTEVSTQRAAKLLNVSRPFVVKLIRDGLLPARTVGRYRRVLLKDVLEYRDQSFREAQNACAEMTKLGRQFLAQKAQAKGQGSTRDSR